MFNKLQSHSLMPVCEVKLDHLFAFANNFIYHCQWSGTVLYGPLSLRHGAGGGETTKRRKCLWMYYIKSHEWRTKCVPPDLRLCGWLETLYRLVLMLRNSSHVLDESLVKTYWIHLVQGRNQRPFLMNADNLLTIWANISFSNRTPFHGLIDETELLLASYKIYFSDNIIGVTLKM